MSHKELEPSALPICASLAILMIALGIVNWLHAAWFGPYLFFSGLIAMIGIAGVWFYAAICDDIGLSVLNIV